MHKNNKLAGKTKFNFDQMQIGATSDDPEVRKNIFIDYFERFEEFPSYLFDNSNAIDTRLFETIETLAKDPATPKAMQEGIAALRERLSWTDDKASSRTL